MRLRERGRCERAHRAARVLIAVALWAATASALPGVLLAASPNPTQAGAGDPRSVGQGPGLVGDPLLAVLVVAGIAVLSVVATLAWIRLTGGPDRGAR